MYLWCRSLSLKHHHNLKIAPCWHTLLFVAPATSKDTIHDIRTHFKIQNEIDKYIKLIISESGGGLQEGAGGRNTQIHLLALRVCFFKTSGTEQWIPSSLLSTSKLKKVTSTVWGIVFYFMNMKSRERRKRRESWSLWWVLSSVRTQTHKPKGH